MAVHDPGAVHQAQVLVGICLLGSLPGAADRAVIAAERQAIERTPLGPCQLMSARFPAYCCDGTERHFSGHLNASYNAGPPAFRRDPHESALMKLLLVTVFILAGEPHVTVNPAGPYTWEECKAALKLRSNGPVENGELVNGSQVTARYSTCVPFTPRETWNAR